MEVLLKNSRNLYQDYKNRIIDVILFGSYAKGKFRPDDIDIAVILKDTKEPEILRLSEHFHKYFDINIHLNVVLIENAISNPLFKTLINEGISILDNKPLHQKIGYESGAIFSINLSKKEKSKKVLFSYALHGKNNQLGILKKLGGKELGRSVFLITIEHVDEFKEFLESWNADFYMMNILS